MNMFRKSDQEAVRHDDVVSQGHRDWDARIERAIASETAWKRGLYLSLMILGGSVAGNLWQANQDRFRVVHIVHDSIGGVIAVSASSDQVGGPTQLMLKREMEEWITNIRTVLIDAAAMKRNIESAYYLVADQSQANVALGHFYTDPGRDPFKRAVDETVSIENVVAVPPTEATIGVNGMQTWRLEWIEVVTSRDGTRQSRSRWAGNVTFKLERPTTIDVAKKDPDGIKIISFSWTGDKR